MIDKLSHFPQKIKFYKSDFYFRTGWEAFSGTLGEDLPRVMDRYCVVTFRPDAGFARRASLALEYLRGRGFCPVGSCFFNLNTYQIRELWRYQWNKLTLERIALSEYLLTLGPWMSVVLRLEDATELPASTFLQMVKGASLPDLRKDDDLRTYLGGRNRVLKFVHTPDEPADLVREIGGVLDPTVRSAYLTAGLQNAHSESDELTSHIKRFEAEYPHQDLDLDWSLATLCDAISARPWAERTELQTLYDMTVSGEQPLHFRRFLCLLDPQGDTLLGWAVCVFGAEYVQHVLPDIEALIPMKVGREK